MRSILVHRIVNQPRDLLRLRHKVGKRALTSNDKSASDANDAQNHLSTPTPSATPTDAPTDAASKLAKEKVWEKQPKRAIFPWRHETEPLERLVDDDNLQGGVLGPGLSSEFPTFIAKYPFMMMAAVRMGVPSYKVFFTTQWKDDLADASSFAFQQAVAGVLSNTYSVPFEDIITEDGKINFTVVTKGEDESESVNGGETATDTAVGEEKNPQSESSSPQETEASTSAPDVEYMLEEKLRKLYEASHEFGKDQMQIELQTQPVHAELVSLMLVPFLTRHAVHEKPTLRHSYRNMIRDLEKMNIDENGNYTSMITLSKAAFQMFSDFVQTRVLDVNKKEGYGTFESTIIAQVLIECDEVFSVTDKATGMLMQGKGTKQRVYHLVRLEAVVEERLPYGKTEEYFEVYPWQIVDWDDLEDGNIWYV